MRNLLVIVFLLISFSASAQTFNFTPKQVGGATAYAPPTAEVLEMYNWATVTDQTFDPGDGVERVVLQNNKKGNPVVHLRGKYVVSLGSLESPGTVTYKGKDYPAYPGTKPGKYVIFIPGKNGLWGKPISN